MESNGKPTSNFYHLTKWYLTLSFLRKISQSLSLSERLHKLRQIIHFGPWRVVPIKLIRMLRPIPQQQLSEHSILPNIVVDQVVQEIRDNSFAFGGQLPKDLLTAITQVTNQLPPDEYQYVQQVNSNILQITQDPNILKVVRNYLQCEPVLLEASLFVSQPEINLPFDGQNAFHFDYAGWESLNVYVYLTDVKVNSSYHVVAKSSHKQILLKDILKGELSIAEGEQRFAGSILNVLGPAGTVFFENTEAFHRRHRGNEKRVMLNLLFASHKSLLSHGRASREQLAKRDREFAKLQN
ncbi:hypothetical protein [Aliikangiella sp. IMCC44632]